MWSHCRSVKKKMSSRGDDYNQSKNNDRNPYFRYGFQYQCAQACSACIDAVAQRGKECKVSTRYRYKP